VHRVGFIIRICHDARSSVCQIRIFLTRWLISYYASPDS